MKLFHGTYIISDFLKFVHLIYKFFESLIAGVCHNRAPAKARVTTLWPGLFYFG